MKYRRVASTLEKGEIYKTTYAGFE